MKCHTPSALRSSNMQQSRVSGVISMFDGRQVWRSGHSACWLCCQNDLCWRREREAHRVPHLSVISCVDLCWISRSGPAWPHGNQTMTGMTRWRGWSQQPQTRCHLFFAYHSQHHVNMWLVCRWGGKDIDSHPLCRVWSKLLFVILLCTVLISLLYFFILHWFWNWVWLKSTKQMKWNLLCAAAVLWDQLE